MNCCLWPNYLHQNLFTFAQDESSSIEILSQCLIFIRQFNSTYALFSFTFCVGSTIQLLHKENGKQFHMSKCFNFNSIISSSYENDDRNFVNLSTFSLYWAATSFLSITIHTKIITFDWEHEANNKTHTIDSTHSTTIYVPLCVAVHVFFLFHFSMR